MSFNFIGKPLIWVPRAKSQARTTLQKLQQLNFNAVGEPMITIDPTACTLPHQPLTVLITSQNAVLALGQLHPDCTIFTVGTATYQAVQSWGKFTKIYSADGDHRSLVNLIIQHHQPSDGPLTYVRGYHIKDDFDKLLRNQGYCVEPYICYIANAVTELPQPFIDLVKQTRCGIIMIYSLRQAEILITLIMHHNLQHFLSSWHVIVMSQSCVPPLMLHAFKSIISADQMTEHAMLEKLLRLNV